MKNRMLFAGLGLMLGITVVAFVMSPLARQAQALALTTTTVYWRQVNDDGFGDSQSAQIPSLAVFGEYLYGGAWHFDGISSTSQIWRTTNGVDWQQVDARSTNGTAHLVVFNGNLYGGSWGGQIWRSSDGLTWTDVITDSFGDSNNGIARFAVFSDTLYASTWNGTTGTEIWRSLNGTDWQQFGEDGLENNPNNVGAIASEVYDGYLYYGVENSSTGAQLWRTDGITLTEIITNGFGTTANSAVSSLAMFNSYLYAGIRNSNGVEVWRSSTGTEWTPVISGGFGNPNAFNANALEVFNGRLYMVIQNDATGLEVWRTSDGTQWEQVGFAGFGDNNNQWSYWDNATTVFKSRLYVGTNNFVTGGEVWQMSDNGLFLPLVLR